jgi:hypothetical protein
MAGTGPGQLRRPARRTVSGYLPGVKATELRIDQDMIECQHVAVNAGFVVAGTVSQFVPGTGETFEDLRYVLERRGAGREDTEPERLRLTRSSLARATE